MAREYIQKVTDDLDGSDGATTVRFGLDGVDWTIDLNAKNETDMRTKLGPFLDGARRVRYRGSRSCLVGKPHGQGAQRSHP